MTNDKNWQALFERVQIIVVDQLGVTIDAVSPSARFIDDLAADSLDAVELVMAFEEAFNIEVPDEDAEKLTRVVDVVDYLCSKGVKP